MTVMESLRQLLMDREEQHVKEMHRREIQEAESRKRRDEERERREKKRDKREKRNRKELRWVRNSELLRCLTPLFEADLKMNESSGQILI